MVNTHARCPEPEFLAAYIDRGLSLAERARVERHLALCPQCVALVAGVVRTVAEVSEFTPHVEVAVEATSRVARRTLVGVLAAAAAVLVFLFAPSLVRPWLDRDAGLVNLVGVSEQRSVLGRLTGGFPHAPLGVPSAGGQGGRAAETDHILLTAAKIRESFGERDTPSRLHDLGLSQLLAGRYDEAAQALLAASREQPANARYLNDVAAVQLERARLSLRPDDLPRALASADRARRLDPSLNEAWFNRALAATALSLTDQAKVAWTEYLARDSVSAWSVEARTRLNDLSKPTPAAAWAGIEQRLSGPIDASLADEAVRTQTTEARNLVDNELLPKWAAAVLAGRNASPELARIRVMAAAFARVAGDAIYLDTVSAIDRADARGADALTALARAHTAYASAAALFGEDRFSESAPGLTAARAGFTSAGSPLADRAAVDLATISYVSGRSDEALTTLGATLRAATAHGYAFNSARSTWIQGLIAFGQGRLADAQSRYEDTLEAFRRMGDAEQQAAAHRLLAALNDYLGEPGAAWEHRLLAFEGLKWSRSPRFRYSLMASAVPSIRAESPETALSVQDAAVAIAKEWRRDGAIADSLAQRASILSSLGRSDEAQEGIREARRVLQQVPDPAFRNRIEVGVLSTESDLARTKSPGFAVVSATRAIELVQQRGDRIRLAQLNLRLAQANIVWGRLDQAQLAIDQGIQAFNAERDAISDEGQISALDESWQLFDAGVQLALRKKDYAKAFALSENARARTLVEARRNPQPRSLPDVQRTLRRGEALVALSQFDEELVIWVIKNDGTTVVQRPLRRLDAVRLVSRQQDEILHEASNPDASADLFNLLLRPIAAQLRGVERLIVVPDSPYEGAAFAAFWDRSRQRFLVEDVSITVSPSASMYAMASQSNRLATNDLAPLILGGPGESSEREAQTIARLYPAGILATGESATKSRFLAEVAGRQVVHVAARMATNPTHPMLSRLILADEPGLLYSGAMMGRDIAAQSMPNTDVVVIDEVETTGRNGGAGTLALSRAFMTAGVPAVVGTLPGANEADTRELMVGFHRQMSTGISAEAALNTLQRNVLQSNGRRLGAWSALVLYGSDR